MRRLVRPWFAAGPVALVVAVLLSACSSNPTRLAPGTLDPDKLLFERGTAALNGKKWFTAREYLRQIVEGYPQSPFRAEAKLGLGDTYLGEGGAANYVLAQNEFREFLTYYPTHPRADYAQYKLAMAHYYQMAKPERDQTETKEAIAEFNIFFERFPNSSLMADARKHYREARDRLSESDYRVGLFYYRSRWYPGAIDRFKAVLAADPEFTRRDAVYYYLGETLIMMKNPAEALVYFDKLLNEFEQSEYLSEAQKRVAELKNAEPAPKPADPPTPTPKPGTGAGALP